MKRLISILISITLLLTLVACKSSDADDEPEATPTPPPAQRENFTFTRENFPRLTGSMSATPLVEATFSVLLGEPRENVRELIEPVFNKTLHSYNFLLHGFCDIIIVSEPPPKMFNEMAQAGFAIEIAPIATEALVFLTGAANPVDNLTSQQLREIYSGEITNWNEVGGNDSIIDYTVRDFDAGSHVLLDKLVMKGENVSIPKQFFYNGFGSSVTISAHRGYDGSASTLGYTFFQMVENTRIAEGQKILSIDGTLPSVDTIRSGEYPLLNPYYVVIGAHEPEDSPTRILYNWLISREGREFIDRCGFVAVGTAQSHEMKWNVSADLTALSPYEPVNATFSRLHDGAMPEFIPSDDYGMLLYYGGASMYANSTFRVSKFGLVTADGTIVTDPIYDRVERAPGSPAYKLTINTTERNMVWYEADNIIAVCALDGSWITPFDYVDAFFTENVMLLRRDNDMFYVDYDIDVYDYSGTFLYNMKNFEWSQSAAGFSDFYYTDFIGNIYGDYLNTRINSPYGNSVYINLLTGEFTYLAYDYVFGFSEGFARILMNEYTDSYNPTWGFINENFEIVIEPEFLGAGNFTNGLSLVMAENEKYHVINTSGVIVHSFDENVNVERLPADSGYRANSYDWTKTGLYTKDFVKIEPPENLFPNAGDNIITRPHYAENGWFYFPSEPNGVYIFRYNDDGSIEDYFLSEVDTIVSIDDTYFLYSYDSFYNLPDSYTNLPSRAYLYLGVITIDGSKIIPPVHSSLTVNYVNGAAGSFLNNSMFPNRQFGVDFCDSAYYRLYNTGGEEIRAGFGVLVYVAELFYLLHPDYFAWFDIDGNEIIRIPLMSYRMD